MAAATVVSLFVVLVTYGVLFCVAILAGLGSFCVVVIAESSRWVFLIPMIKISSPPYVNVMLMLMMMIIIMHRGCIYLYIL